MLIVRPAGCRCISSNVNYLSLGKRSTYQWYKTKIMRHFISNNWFSIRSTRNCLKILFSEPRYTVFGGTGLIAPVASVKPYFFKKLSSPAPVTIECEDIICSNKVVPDLGIPSMNIGLTLLYFIFELIVFFEKRWLCPLEQMKKFLVLRYGIL